MRSSGASNSHIQVRDVYKIFHDRTRSRESITALAGCSLDVREGEFVSVVGPSGCGKTTLSTLIGGLDRPTSGDVYVDGERVSRPLTDIGIVFQSPVLLPWRTAAGNVLLQLEQRRRKGSPKEKEDNRRRTYEILKFVGLEGFEDRLPRELSGGMQQRVALCRALVHEPSLLLMDEPFAALDALTRDQLKIDLQRLWLRQKSTVVFITHNLEEAVFLSDRVAVMSRRPGRIERVFDIDLPRPRRLKIEASAGFTAYSSEIREMFVRSGVLVEEDDFAEDDPSIRLGEP